MIAPDRTELLVRAVALYLPVVLAIGLAVRRPLDRRRGAAALLATAWNVPALLAVNLLAVRAGWWTFAAHGGTTAGVPADLWIGWALLWGAVPLLATTTRLPAAAAALVAADLVLMPLAEPAVVLGGSWLVGEAVAVAVALVPGLVLGRWTAVPRRPGGRAALQVVAFTGLLFFVLPALVFEVAGAGWGPLLDRPRWHLVAAAVVLAPAAATALQAVREFATAGGTPFPLDPPTRLVTTGPYAYVANPMQLGATILLAAWGVLLASPEIVAAAAMGAVFSAGLATWSERADLTARFGDGWHRYRRRVRPWLPRRRPAVTEPGAIHVATTCGPCAEVGRFLATRRTVGLTLTPAEACATPLRRITYDQGGRRDRGVAAIGRALEHAHLGWAVASWIGRLPGLVALLQLVADAVGGDPRDLPAERVPVDG